MKTWRIGADLVAGLGSVAIVLGLTPALASESKDRPKFGATSIFATVPAPGHPFGVAVDGDRVYVSTSVGDFFAGNHMNSAGERVLAYDRQGELVHTTPIATMPDATMGLWGLALDGNPERSHNLFVADMNGRILRIGLNDDRQSAPEVFAAPPPEFSGGWRVTMWNDITFDRAGNLLMTDDKPRLWRITPDGKASVWFTDPRIAGLLGFAGGPLGGRIDPSGQFYYFTITLSAAFPIEAVGTGFESSIIRPHPGCGTWVAIERSNGGFLGWFGFRPPKDGSTDDPELGDRLRKSGWGNGYATEGSRAHVQKDFSEYGVRRVFATTMTVNIASRRVMEKAGLKFVRTFFLDWPDYIEGAEHGDVEYAPYREEWEST